MGNSKLVDQVKVAEGEVIGFEKQLDEGKGCGEECKFCKVCFYPSEQADSEVI